MFKASSACCTFFTDGPLAPSVRRCLPARQASSVASPANRGFVSGMGDFSPERDYSDPDQTGATALGTRAIGAAEKPEEGREMNRPRPSFYADRYAVLV